MKSTRRTQPYRKGTKRPFGSALLAMQRGKAKYLRHPMDAKRKSQRKRKRRLRRRAIS